MKQLGAAQAQLHGFVDGKVDAAEHRRRQRRLADLQAQNAADEDAGERRVVQSVDFTAAMFGIRGLFISSSPGLQPLPLEQITLLRCAAPCAA